MNTFFQERNERLITEALDTRRGRRLSMKSPSVFLSFEEQRRYIKESLKGDGRALSILYSCIYPILLRYCKQIFDLYPILRWPNSTYEGLTTNSVARTPHDFATEIFLLLFKYPDQFLRSKYPVSYYITVAHNYLSRTIKKTITSTKTECNFLEETTTIQFELPHVTPLQITLESAFSALTKTQRKIIKAHKLEEKSQQEVARQFNITTNCVKRHVGDAMIRLRKFFAEKGITELPILE